MSRKTKPSTWASSGMKGRITAWTFIDCLHTLALTICQDLFYNSIRFNPNNKLFTWTSPLTFYRWWNWDSEILSEFIQIIHKHTYIYAYIYTHKHIHMSWYTHIHIYANINKYTLHINKHLHKLFKMCGLFYPSNIFRQ